MVLPRYCSLFQHGEDRADRSLACRRPHAQPEYLLRAPRSHRQEQITQRAPSFPFLTRAWQSDGSGAPHEHIRDYHCGMQLLRTSSGSFNLLTTWCIPGGANQRLRALLGHVYGGMTLLHGHQASGSPILPRTAAYLQLHEVMDPRSH